MAAWWISIGVAFVALLLTAFLVDRRDRRGGRDRVGRMRLPGRLARYREARIANNVVQYEYDKYRAERPEPPKVD